MLASNGILKQVISLPSVPVIVPVPQTIPWDNLIDDVQSLVIHHLPYTTLGRFLLTRSPVKDPQTHRSLLPANTVLSLKSTLPTLYQNERTFEKVLRLLSRHVTPQRIISFGGRLTKSTLAVLANQDTPVFRSIGLQIPPNFAKMRTDIGHFLVRCEQLSLTFGGRDVDSIVYLIDKVGPATTHFALSYTSSCATADRMVPLAHALLRLVLRCRSLTELRVDLPKVFAILEPGPVQALHGAIGKENATRLTEGRPWMYFSGTYFDGLSWRFIDMDRVCVPYHTNPPLAAARLASDFKQGKVGIRDLWTVVCITPLQLPTNSEEADFPYTPSMLYSQAHTACMGCSTKIDFFCAWLTHSPRAAKCIEDFVRVKDSEFHTFTDMLNSEKASQSALERFDTILSSLVTVEAMNSDDTYADHLMRLGKPGGLVKTRFAWTSVYVEILRKPRDIAYLITHFQQYKNAIHLFVRHLHDICDKVEVKYLPFVSHALLTRETLIDSFPLIKQLIKDFQDCRLVLKPTDPLYYTLDSIYHLIATFALPASTEYKLPEAVLF